MNMFRGRILLGVLTITLAHSALGGSLGDRAKDVSERSEKKKKKKKKEESHSHRNRHSSSYFGSGTYPSSHSSHGFMSEFWGWLIMAPFAYRSDDPGASMFLDGAEQEEGWADHRASKFPQHDLGQATAPYVRADYNRQWADRVDADDGRLELGYKPFAVHARMTRYTDEVDDVYDLQQYYVVLRYGGYQPDDMLGSFEIGAGLGMVHHSGNALERAGLDDDSSGAMTFLVKYYPVEWIGVEFRPAWYRFYDIVHGDYDLSASVGLPYVQVRGGYRWIWENGVGIRREISGFYAGVSVSF